MAYLFYLTWFHYKWKRIELTEPHMTHTKSSDEHLPNGIKDGTGDIEAQTNQIIVEKYRLLKTLKQRMTKMKRDFNDRVLKLQHEKLEICAELSKKIKKFRQNYEQLCPNDKDLVDVEEFTENVIYFDGKSFKVRFTICFSIEFHLQTVSYSRKFV